MGEDIVYLVRRMVHQISGKDGVTEMEVLAPGSSIGPDQSGIEIEFLGVLKLRRFC